MTSTWLSYKPPGYCTTWEYLAQELLDYFFPPSRTTQIINQILHFRKKKNLFIKLGNDSLDTIPNVQIIIWVNVN